MADTVLQYDKNGDLRIAPNLPNGHTRWETNSQRDSNGQFWHQNTETWHTNKDNTDHRVITWQHDDGSIFSRSVSQETIDKNGVRKNVTANYTGDGVLTGRSRVEVRNTVAGHQRLSADWSETKSGKLYERHEERDRWTDKHGVTHQKATVTENSHTDKGNKKTTTTYTETDTQRDGSSKTKEMVTESVQKADGSTDTKVRSSEKTVDQNGNETTTETPPVITTSLHPETGQTNTTASNDDTPDWADPPDDDTTDTNCESSEYDQNQSDDVSDFA